MFNIKTTAREDGTIEVKSIYKNGSSEQALAELMAVIEDVVINLIKQHRKVGDLKTKPAQYYNTIAEILKEMAKE